MPDDLDLDGRFRSLDRVPSPPAWPDLETYERPIPVRPVAPEPRWRRPVAALAGLAIAVIGFAFAAGVFGEDGRGPDTPGSTDVTTAPSVTEPPTPSPAPSGDVVYEADGMVLQAETGPAMFCVGMTLDSLPPQCSGQPIPNWDWDGVADEQEQGGVRWGTYHLTGTFDGTNFTVIDVTAPSPPPEEPDEIVAPCPMPDGGWVASDPSKTSDADMRAALRAAGREPDFSGGWIDYWQGPPSEFETPGPNDIVVTAAFTGDLDRHRDELAQIWGGPLCVVEFEHTEDELKQVQRDIGQASPEELGMILLWSSVDVVHNEVEVGVVVADDDLQARMDERYGEGVVVLIPALTPVAD